MRKVTTGIAALVGGLVGAWALYGALLYAMQDALIFPIPGGVDRGSLDAAAREIGAQPLSLQASDGVALYGWHREAGQRRAVMYLHGNGETVASSMTLQRRVHQRGWDFATVAYRGYPGSDGAPHEAGLLLDARALWDHLVQQVGVPPERIVIHGRSLGGGVGIALVDELLSGGQRPAALIVESSFVSVLELARRQAPLYPVRWMLRNPFDSGVRAERLDLPVLVLHGDADATIPVDHGRRLAQRLPNARYVEVAGRGHNELLTVTSREGRQAWLTLLTEVSAAE